MKITLSVILLSLLSLRAVLAAEPEAFPFRNTELPVNKRVDDLISHMTVDEKISQTMMASPAIPRLGVPAYDWWNEGLHGVARNGVATVFPQAIGLAATWNPDLHHRIADVISTEARAKNNEAVAKSGGDAKRYQGLTIWSPNINIFRDPRWGRGQETYGEDPFLTGRMAVAFVTGLQGTNPTYLKTVGTVKHYAVHSGPESLRHQFDAVVSERDLHETYLPAFEAGIREGHAWSLMSAYNAVDGIPMPANKRMLTDILRRDWGFQGAVVGDVDTVADITRGHHYTNDAAAAAALAIKAGNDLCSGKANGVLPDSLKKGLITEGEIDGALRRLFTLRFKLGQFDPQSKVPYASISMNDSNAAAHDALALEAARQSLVLLKNDGTLPWNPKDLKTLAVLGPTATEKGDLLGNYSGTPAKTVTILEGLKAKFEPLGVSIMHDAAVPLVDGYVPRQRKGDNGEPMEKRTAEPAPSGLEKALEMARKADHIILTLGITPDLEGEEKRGLKLEGFAGGDRTSVLLPKSQAELLEKVSALGKPVVVILNNGSALSLDTSKANAILEAWYYGQRGADAVAEALIGEVNPGGRLPVTFYANDADLPSFTDYSMKNRTYRYFTGKPLFAFGYGLSYTTFSYGDPKLSQGTANAAETVQLSVPLTNTGKRAGDEVVQVYAHSVKPPVEMPNQWLVGFQRASLKPGESTTVTIPVSVQRLRRWDEKSNSYVVDPGSYELRVGSSSDAIHGTSTLSVTAESK